MKKSKTPPLKTGTAVTINIAQGAAIAQGIITDAEYDDGWLYRIDITSGDDCQKHRNREGELWVCDFEIEPIGDQSDATRQHINL